MMRISIGRIFIIVVSMLLFAGSLYAQIPQNVYGLRQLSDEDWIGMTTEQRLKTLNISNNHARNQTFFGDFGRSLWHIHLIQPAVAVQIADGQVTQAADSRPTRCRRKGSSTA